ALDLAIDVRGGRVQRRAHAEGRRLADDPAEGIHALGHAAQHVDEAHAVDVEDGGRVGVVAGPGRVAGHGQDVADVERVSAEQVGLHAHQVPVATGEVHVHVEAGAVAHEQRGGQHRHSHAAERAVVDVDDLDAALPEDLGALHALGDGWTAWRIAVGGDRVT